MVGPANDLNICRGVGVTLEVFDNIKKGVWVAVEVFVHRCIV
jgi:hypothetical protein